MASAPNIVDRPRPTLWDRLDWKQRLVLLGSSSTFLASSTLFLLSASKAVRTVSAGNIPEEPTAVPTETFRTQKTKTAFTTQWLQEQQAPEESAKAKKLAESIDFADDKKQSSPAYGQVLLPWTESQKEVTREKTRSTILALRRLGVEWEAIEDMAKYSYFGLIKRLTIQVAPKKFEQRSLSVAEKILIEISIDDPELKTLSHETEHIILRSIKTEDGKTAIGLMEASATWFQFYVNEQYPPKPDRFLGCGRAPGDYDYYTGYFDFDNANQWFFQKTGKFLLGTMINANTRWVAMGNDYSLPLPYLYQSIEDEFKIPKAETKSHLEGTKALQCVW